jgi:hypothetical protein
MGLLSLDEIPDHSDPESIDRPPDTTPLIPGRTGGTFRVGKHAVDLATLLPAIEQTAGGDILSNGQWSLHEMLAYLLHRIGPAHCWITSWGISSKPMQAVLGMVRDGRIQKLKALFDHRVRLQCPDAFQLLIEMSNDPRVQVSLTKIHMKTIVLMNDQYALRLYTSANLTMNPRIEGYNLATDRSMAEQNRDFIETVFVGANPFTE